MKGGDANERSQAYEPESKPAKFPSWRSGKGKELFPRRLQDRNPVLTIFPGSRFHLARQSAGHFILRSK